MFEDDKMIFHCPACFKVDSIKLEGLLNVLKILRQKVNHTLIQLTPDTAYYYKRNKREFSITQ